MRLLCHSKASSEILHALGQSHLMTTNPAEATAEIAIHPRTIEDMLDAILQIGEQIDEHARATDLVVRLRGRLHAAQDFINPYVEGPPVLILDALDPLRVPGLWVPQLVERAGGQFPWNPTSAVPDAGAAAGPQMAYRTAGEAVTIKPAQIEMHRPEFVVFALADQSLEDARAAMRTFTAQNWFQSLPAARKNQIAIIEGTALATPGPGLVDAFEFLVGFLNQREELIPESLQWERVQKEPRA